MASRTSPEHVLRHPLHRLRAHRPQLLGHRRFPFGLVGEMVGDDRAVRAHRLGQQQVGVAVRRRLLDDLVEGADEVELADITDLREGRGDAAPVEHTQQAHHGERLRLSVQLPDPRPVLGRTQPVREVQQAAVERVGGGRRRPRRRRSPRRSCGRRAGSHPAGSVPRSAARAGPGARTGRGRWPVHGRCGRSRSPTPRWRRTSSARWPGASQSSPSRNVRYSPRAASRPVLRAVASPPFFSWRMYRTWATSESSSAPVRECPASRPSSSRRRARTRSRSERFAEGSEGVGGILLHVVERHDDGELGHLRKARRRPGSETFRWGYGG